MTEEHSICEPLLELATPHVYRHNLFRVLGVPVGATPQDVQRRQNRLSMAAKLGIQPSDGSGGPLAIKPPPTEEDVRAAIERLTRPVDRLLHEIFWFWPGSDGKPSDPAIEAIQNGRLTEATEIWRQRATSNGHAVVATHNLAVMDHLVALDYEATLAGQGLNPKQQKSLAALWARVFDRWREVVDREEFWTVLKDRVRSLDDAVLTTGLVRRIRATLPKALLLINAKIAYNAAERADAALAQRHVGLLREAGFGNDLAEEALREAIKPIRNRIKMAIRHAEDQWKSVPHRGNHYVRELYEQAKGLLAIVDAILPADHPTRAGLHDDVAEAMLNGQIAFAKKTNDWLDSIELLRLAQELVAGEAVRSRLDENIGILDNNNKQGNDWCAPGYWELPEEVVSQLESAREKAVAGDYEGALRMVLVLDPAIGPCLCRSVAFCLVGRGWRIAGEGMDEFNLPTGRMQKFLDTIHRLGTISVPTPYMQPWQLPPCPVCGGTSYTRWVNGEYKGQKFWMCSSCSERDDREREEKKRNLAVRIREGLEYMLLAAEIDKHDPGVRDGVDTLKRIASDVSASVPTTKALKQRLSVHRVRHASHRFEPSQADRVCFFCGENAADDSCAIRLPMCGDVRPVDLLFHKGIEYRSGEVVVPRCRRCRDEHRELPGRIEQWYEARLAASDEEDFPEIVAELESAGAVASRALAVVAERKKDVADAQEALDEANAIGQQCDRCHAATHWQDGLCRQCDGEVFALGGWSRFGIGVLVVLGLVGFLFFQATAIGAAILVAGGGLYAAVKYGQRRQRHELREMRKKELAERRAAAVAAATERLNQATAAHGGAEKAAMKPVQAYNAIKKTLKATQERATAEFEQNHPAPTHTPGVKPESAFLTFGRITELRSRGWGFGRELGADGQSVGAEPVDVTGLVAREPHPAANRVYAQCPSCGKRQRVARRDDVASLECSCGVRFARCPICGAGVKMAHLEWHHSYYHKGMRAPSPAAETPRAEDAATDATSRLEDRIMQILQSHDGQSGLHVAPNIPPRKLANATKHCGVPSGDTILGLIDCTVFGSAADAIVFGKRGLYYHNVAGTEPNPGFVAYHEFPNIHFSTAFVNCIKLGGNRYCNKAGSSVSREKIIEILEAVRLAVIEGDLAEKSKNG